MEPNYEKVEGQRVGSWNYVDSRSFCYLKERERDGSLYLRCKFSARADLESACQGRAVIELETNQLRVTKMHTCNSSQVEVEVLKAKSKMKKVAAGSQTLFSVLHRNVLEEVAPEVREKIPMKNILSSMKAARRRM